MFASFLSFKIQCFLQQLQQCIQFSSGTRLFVTLLNTPTLVCLFFGETLFIFFYAICLLSNPNRTRQFPPDYSILGDFSFYLFCLNLFHQRIYQPIECFYLSLFVVNCIKYKILLLFFLILKAGFTALLKKTNMSIFLNGKKLLFRNFWHGNKINCFPTELTSQIAFQPPNIRLFLLLLRKITSFPWNPVHFPPNSLLEFKIPKKDVRWNKKSLLLSV